MDCPQETHFQFQDTQAERRRRLCTPVGPKQSKGGKLLFV
jgi:hypothetical protein